MNFMVVALACVIGHIFAIALPLALLWHGKTPPGWALVFMLCGLLLMPGVSSKPAASEDGSA